MQNTRVVYIYISQVSVNVFYFRVPNLFDVPSFRLKSIPRFGPMMRRIHFFIFFGVKLQIVVG